MPSQQIAMLAQIFFLFVEIGADDRCNPFLSSPVTHFYICRYLSRMVPKMTKIIYAATHLYICTYLSRTVTLTVDPHPHPSTWKSSLRAFLIFFSMITLLQHIMVVKSKPFISKKRRMKTERAGKRKKAERLQTINPICNMKVSCSVVQSILGRRTTIS